MTKSDKTSSKAAAQAKAKPKKPAPKRKPAAKASSKQAIPEQASPASKTRAAKADAAKAVAAKKAAASQSAAASETSVRQTSAQLAETPTAASSAAKAPTTQGMAELPSEHAPAPLHGTSLPLRETSSTLANPSSDYLNREMSWLAFNERVLAEAKEPRNPLLERLKFTAICGSNLDEFFMVRVAGVHGQIAAGVQTKSLDGLLPREVLKLVRERTHIMMAQIEEATREVLAALEGEGIKLWRMDELSGEEREEVRRYYLDQIQPVLTPLVVDPSHPFPYISNLSLNLAVLLDGKKKKAGPDFARVKVPVGVLPRVVEIGERMMLLEDVMAAHMDELFKGRKIRAVHLFRVTRNTDYEFDEEEADDLLATVEDGLRRRRFGSPVRLEVLQDVPKSVLEYLQDRMTIAAEDVYKLQGPLGTSDFMGLPIERPELAFEPFKPHVLAWNNLSGSVAEKREDETIFDVLQRRDILLHHPYDSFETVLHFLESAAEDPDVLAIKQTLYRTGDDPRLLGALRSAAEAGKQVVAFIELKARFDEQRNISWAKKLERAGAHVVYGMAGLKTHAKVTLVVRREGKGLKRYVHIGTGNYNPKTAKLYTDLSLLTGEDALGADATELFNYLTGYADAHYQHMLVAPHHARDGFIQRLERETQIAREGGDAWFVGKCNQLTDPDMIDALYKASQAGVRVQMVIRGVCCLRPEVEGLSENITIHSLLGRFLEHSRIYAFGGGGDPEVYFGSADWMNRNLSRRVEVIAPVLNPEFREVFLDMMNTELSDERGSWVLREDGAYEKLEGERSAQAEFMQED